MASYYSVHLYTVHLSIPVISLHRYSIVRPFANSFTVQPTLWPTIGAISLRTLHGSTPQVTETTHRGMIPQLPAFPC